MDLEKRFQSLTQAFRPELIPNWSSIVEAYSGKGRQYHNLDHLEAMFQWTDRITDQLEDYEVFSWAILYHDIVYKVLRKDNEEQSAAFAKKALLRMGMESSRIERCTEHIIATKEHGATDDEDRKYLLDIDLSILGAAEAAYATYTQQIRKEYQIYPNVLYNPGRRKVITHFLEQTNIFKTSYFRNQLEHQARQNLEKELRSL